MNALDLLRESAASQIEAGTPEIVRRDILKSVGLLPPDIEFRDRSAGAGTLRRRVQEHHDAVRIGVSQRLEQDRVHDGEDRCIRSDSEGERGHGSDCEAGALQEHPNGVLEVFEEGFHRSFFRRL